MAFPVLNMLSFWTTFAGPGCHGGDRFSWTGGAPLGGWTAYPPLSAWVRCRSGRGMGQTLWIISIAIFCGASLLGALNFIATTLDLRARGMSLMRMPLTCWAGSITAILGAAWLPVLLAAGVLLLLDRIAGTSFFLPGRAAGERPDSSATHGGSPLLWQHLFWFFGHPEVYIAIMPGMGVTSHDSLDVRAQADFRVPGDGLRHSRPSASSASWSGAITCSSAA